MKTYSWLDQNRFLSHLRTAFCALAIVGALLTLPSVEAGTPVPRAEGLAPSLDPPQAPSWMWFIATVP